MANLNITREWHARAFAAGLTRYTYEQITETWADAKNAEGEFWGAWRACQALVSNWERDSVLPYYPEEVYPLVGFVYSITEKMPVLNGFGGRGSSENWPVSKWAAAAKKFRNLTAKLDKTYVQWAPRINQLKEVA